MDNTFQDNRLRTITYDDVRKAMKGKPFTMKLTKTDGKIVGQAADEAIDSRLEACFVPDRGDEYVWEDGFLNCVVSVESFPVLLRRLSEAWIDGDEEICEAAASLLDACLDVLGLDGSITQTKKEQTMTPILRRFLDNHYSHRPGDTGPHSDKTAEKAREVLDASDLTTQKLLDDLGLTVLLSLIAVLHRKTVASAYDAGEESFIRAEADLLEATAIRIENGDVPT